MNIKRIIFISFFSLIAITSSFSQTIKIHYHLGFDCRPNGDSEKGICMLHERIEYNAGRNLKHFNSKKLEIETIVKERESGEFGKNIENESIKIYRINKKVKSKIFNQLTALIKLFEEPQSYSEIGVKRVITKWNKNIFKLSKRKIKKNAKKYNENLKPKEIEKIITDYIKKENEGFRMSSMSEFINISFEYKKIRYSLSQNLPGGTNVSWQITKNDKEIYVISPELNKIILEFLTNKMRAKNKMLKFQKIKVLEEAFNTE